MELVIHDVEISKFLRLLPVMFKSTEWERGNKFYMSGGIRIMGLEITLFSKDYDFKLAVADEYREVEAKKEGERDG